METLRDMQLTTVEWPGLAARLKGRERLSHEQLCERFFDRLPRAAVLACFAVLEDECLPVAQLRPSDAIVPLLTPATRNPLKGLFARASFEDRVGEIQDRLSVQLEKLGTASSWPTVETFGEFVSAWCGDIPGNGP
jgi:hypothetical protein